VTTIVGIVPNCRRGRPRQLQDEEIGTPVGVSMLVCFRVDNQFVDAALYAGIVHPDGYFRASKSTGHGSLEGYIDVDADAVPDRGRKLHEIDMALLTSAPNQCYFDSGDGDVASSQSLLQKASDWTPGFQFELDLENFNCKRLWNKARKNN